MKIFTKFMLKTKKHGSNFLHEMKEGIRVTIPYVLSHHQREQYHKCFFIIGIPVCSRCAGIYTGILFGFLIYFLNFVSLPYLLMIFLFPSFALLDWTVTAFKFHNGNNHTRFFSGILLGTAYAFGLSLLFTGMQTVIVLFIGLIYGSIAILLIILKNRIEMKKAKFSEKSF